MSGKHYVFDENRSKQEAMSKAEVEAMQRQIEDSLDLIHSDISNIQNELNEIPVIKLLTASTNKSILNLLHNKGVKEHQLCLIVNNSQSEITFSAGFFSPVWSSGSTKTFIYQQDFTKKSVSGTVNNIGEVSFNNFISITAGSNILFRNITLL